MISTNLQLTTKMAVQHAEVHLAWGTSIPQTEPDLPGFGAGQWGCRLVGV